MAFPEVLIAAITANVFHTVAEVFGAVSAVLIAVITAVATLVAARVIDRVPWLGVLGRPKTLEWIFALFPVLVIGTGVALAYVWDTEFTFPSLEYYRVAAEVILIALVGLIIERDVIRAVRTPVLVGYGLLFVAGEIAAFVAISESLPGATEDNVGGGYGWTVLLSTVTSTALLTAAVLAAAAAISRGLSTATTTVAP